MRTSKANPKLVFIYGPPGVGKLTVAKELAKLTGFKLFHNHLTVDLIHSLFNRDQEIFHHLVRKYRQELLTIAAREKVNCIFTFVYYAKEDDPIVRKLLSGARKHGAEVLFIKLHCKDAELYKRVKNPSRQAYRKLKKINTLKSIMREKDFVSVIPFGESLVIDNTKLSPKKTAEKIIKHYKLSKVKRGPLGR